MRVVPYSVLVPRTVHSYVVHLCRVHVSQSQVSSLCLLQGQTVPISQSASEREIHQHMRAFLFMVVALWTGSMGPFTLTKRATSALEECHALPTIDGSKNAMHFQLSIATERLQDQNDEVRMVKKRDGVSLVLRISSPSVLRLPQPSGGIRVLYKTVTDRLRPFVSLAARNEAIKARCSVSPLVYALPAAR